eukprot:983813-Pelagomonas_calceolata.AAC.3
MKPLVWEILTPSTKTASNQLCYEQGTALCRAFPSRGIPFWTQRRQGEAGLPHLVHAKWSSEGRGRDCCSAHPGSEGGQGHRPKYT